MPSTMPNIIAWIAFMSFDYTKIVAAGKKQKPPPRGSGLCFCALDALNVFSVRTLRALLDFEADFIANFEIIEHHAAQVLGVEEKVFRFAFASDETETPVRQRLDFSSHVFVAL